MNLRKNFLIHVGSLMGQGTSEQLSTQAQIISEINLANKIGEATDILGKNVLDSTSQLTKVIKEQVDIVVSSNKVLAASNERYAKGMLWLTLALVLPGILESIIYITITFSTK